MHVLHISLHELSSNCETITALAYETAELLSLATDGHTGLGRSSLDDILSGFSKLSRLITSVIFFL